MVAFRKEITILWTRIVQHVGCRRKKRPASCNARESEFRPFSTELFMTVRKRILFLCTGNCCRSQMAEGLLRSLFGDRLEALSAGAKPAAYVHPRAAAVMAEQGIDIKSQTSKSIHAFLPPEGSPPDVIIGVCSSADENCPTFPETVERWHWPFNDPYHAAGSEEEQMSEFRRVRDEIRARIVAEFGGQIE